jgi:hypothetical protein
MPAPRHGIPDDAARGKLQKDRMLRPMHHKLLMNRHFPAMSEVPTAASSWLHQADGHKKWQPRTHPPIHAPIL